MKYSIVFLAALAGVNASPMPRPQAVTESIAPEAPIPTGCMADYSGTFGIAAMNITAGAAGAGVTQLPDGQPGASSGAAKVTQLSDGQPQAATSAAPAPPAPAPVSVLPDGQPQAPTSVAAPIAQISDGQIQGPTAMPTMPAINQIGDGQIQAPTMNAINQIGDGQIQAPTAPAPPPPTASGVAQISDGQIQAPTAAPPAPTAPAVTVLSDGQPQAPTAPPAPTATAASVLPDGQPQAPAPSAPVATQLSDGQPQAPPATGVSVLPDGQPQAPTGTPMPGPKMVACNGDSTLALELKGGVLTDDQGRIGYIASNYQFQFDGPPQAGAIYTAGFSVCGNGSLALGGSTTFYQCLSGDFYNLYDRNWAAQCNPVTINMVDLIDCAA